MKQKLSTAFVVAYATFAAVYLLASIYFWVWAIPIIMGWE